MNKKNFTLILLKFFVGILILIPVNNFGQTTNEKIEDKKVDLQLTNATLMYFLSTLSVDYEIPIGFEQSLVDNNEFKINLNIVNGTLKDVLNLVSNQVPNYRWKINDGVINFVPVENRDIFLEKLLDTHISKFAPEKGIKVYQLKKTIYDLPEIKFILESNNIEFVKSEIFSKGLLNPVDADICIENTNFRGVLNNLVKKGNSKFWKIERLSADKEYLKISF